MADKVLIPITPDLLDETTNARNKTVVLANGEVLERIQFANLAKELGIEENSFEFKAITPASPAPKKTGLYFPMSAGKYTNYGGIEITREQFDSSFIFIVFDGAGFELLIKPIDFIPHGVIQSGDYNAISGDAVYNYAVDKESIKDLIVTGSESVIFVFVKGYINPPSGYITNTNNWLSAKVLNSKPNTKYLITGFPKNDEPSSMVDSIRVGFKVGGIWQVLQSQLNTDSLEVTTPNEYTDFYVTVAAEANIGIDPENNKYKDSFKIQVVPFKEGYLVAEKIKGDIKTDQIKNIEESIKDLKKDPKKYYFGSGSPLLTKGVKGDSYLDILTGIKYVKGPFFWETNFFSFEIPIKTNIQNIFNDQDVSIYRLKNKSKYIPKYNGNFLVDITTLAEQYLTNFTYIDIINGLDTNDGTIDKPLKTLSKAVSLGKYDLYIKSGWYDRDSVGFINSSINIEKCTIICEDDVFLTSSDPASKYVFTKESDGLQKTTRSALFSIVDISTKFDKKKGFFAFKETFTRDECLSTPDSFYKNENELFVNTNRLLDNNIKLILQTDNLQFFLGVNCKMFYMENANIYVQNPSSALSVKSGNTQSHSIVCLKNINTYLNRLGNGISVDNLINVFTQNCGGYGMRRDALNYHTSKLAQGFIKMQVFEFNGWSSDTGLNSEGEGSSNGSTAHEGMSIYRFGGNFEISRGSTVVDVNDGIRSINFDIVAIGSYLGHTASYQIQDGQMWLYNCIGYDSSNVCKADGNLNDPTIFYDKDCILIGKKIGKVELLAS